MWLQDFYSQSRGHLIIKSRVLEASREESDLLSTNDIVLIWTKVINHIIYYIILFWWFDFSYAFHDKLCNAIHSFHKAHDMTDLIQSVPAQMILFRHTFIYKRQQHGKINKVSYTCTPVRWSWQQLCSCVSFPMIHRVDICPRLVAETQLRHIMRTDMAWWHMCLVLYGTVKSLI